MAGADPEKAAAALKSSAGQLRNEAISSLAAHGPTGSARGNHLGATIAGNGRQATGIGIRFLHLVRG